MSTLPAVPRVLKLLVAAQRGPEFRIQLAQHHDIIATCPEAKQIRKAKKKCRSVEDRHPESDHREPRDLSSITLTANKKQKAKKKLIATTQNSKSP